MKTREDVYAWLVEALVDLLELDAESITLDAELAALDVDSIDAVDIVVRFRDLTGRRVEPEVFRTVRTIRDVVEALYSLIKD
jgi:acyl carrier protein